MGAQLYLELGSFSMNKDLSKYFTYEDLTRTDYKEFQKKNQETGIKYLPALESLGDMLDGIIDGIGVKVRLCSAYRCEELNFAVGSSKRSQHLRGEAADFCSIGGDTLETRDKLFEQVLYYLIQNGIMFGQIIKESAQRSYGTTYWIHISLGAPFRPLFNCGQVLEATDGKYKMIKKIPINS